ARSALRFTLLPHDLAASLRPGISQRADEDREPPLSPFSMLGVASRPRGPAAADDSWLSRSLAQRTGYDDTHPCLADRLEAMRIEPYVPPAIDRKSTRLNSSHQIISYAVFCLKKKNKIEKNQNINNTHKRNATTSEKY